MKFLENDALMQKILPVVLLVIFALVLNFLLSRLIRRQYQHVNPKVAARQKTLLHATSSVLRYTIWGAAVLVAISIFNGNAVAGFLSLGTFAVVAGFAASHGIKDFLAGMFLLLEGQYAVGDHLFVSEQVQGRVEEFALRTTTIRLEDGRRAVIRHDNLNQFIVTASEIVS